MAPRSFLLISSFFSWKHPSTTLRFVSSLYYLSLLLAFSNSFVFNFVFCSKRLILLVVHLRGLRFQGRSSAGACGTNAPCSARIFIRRAYGR